MDFRKSSMEDLVMSQKVFNGIFKGKTVLITGHTGLVGGFKEYPITFAPRLFNHNVNQEPMNPV